MSGNNILFKKQFDFQEKHSTKHATMQLVDQKIFGKNLYTQLKKSLYTSYFY